MLSGLTLEFTFAPVPKRITQKLMQQRTNALKFCALVMLGYSIASILTDMCYSLADPSRMPTFLRFVIPLDAAASVLYLSFWIMECKCQVNFEGEIILLSNLCITLQVWKLSSMEDSYQENAVSYEAAII
jgi:hypothetical protein